VVSSFEFRTSGQGLYEVTAEVESLVREAAVEQGLCTVFLKHTSASLVIQENADPTARMDLERWINRLVLEGDPAFRHTLEGPDDMPAHIKASLTQVSLGIPILSGELTLGTWQGIYLWEHRRSPHRRTVVVSVLGG
jgi:secondary thiamine-phosphate synthase enzyme